MASLGDGIKNVTTAGTAVQLGTGTAAKWVICTARSSNTGTIAVGASTVLAAVGATRRGAILTTPGDSVTITDIDDLGDVWLDSTVNGEGVNFVYGSPA